MDKPHENAATSQYIPRGAFSVAAVRADPETTGMEVPFAAVQQELKTKHRASEDLEETVEEHEAVIIVRDRAVDKIVRSFDLRLLDMVDKNRDDPRYRRYFPQGLRAVTEADARQAEPKLVRDIIKTLDEDKAKPGFDALHAEFHDKLLASVQAVEAADAACAEVEAQLAFLQDKVLAEIKVRWVEERKKLYAELSKKYPHDPSRVESYFARFAKPRKKKAE
ncbi:MAG: hypothetical protein IPM54_30725 [Polyangiaceae bacterium]|nr:hypothetical protein [Polyangiaceae bacterium]